MLCKPGELATISNPSAPLYFPASNNNTVNSTSPESNSTLSNNTITTAVATQQIKKNDSISFKTTLQPEAYAGSKYLDILQRSNFIFGSGSRLCPTNDCKQEFIDAYYRMPTSESPSEHVVSGTLKIENKITSTSAIEEDRKTGNNATIFSVDFDLATTTSGFANPEFTYSVSGTFDNATKVLAFEGQRSRS
jgi:hypothetical protein